MINYYTKKELKEIASEVISDIDLATEIAIESECVSENKAERIRMSFILVKEIVEEYFKLVEEKNEKEN